MRERTAPQVRGIFERLEDGSRARTAQIEAFRQVQGELATEGLVLVNQEQPRGLRIPKVILPLAAALPLIVACARPERGMEFPAQSAQPGRTPAADVVDRAIDSQKTPSQKPPERQLEAGWQTFRSTISPYQINYPARWISKQYDSAGLSPFGPYGKKGDLFLGETVSGFRTEIVISTEPIENWVKLEDYGKSVMNQLFQLKTGTEKETTWTMTRGSKVGDKDTMRIEGQTAHSAVIGMVFIYKDRGWRIILLTHPSVTNQEQSRFMQILSTFSLIQ